MSTPFRCFLFIYFDFLYFLPVASGWGEPNRLSMLPPTSNASPPELSYAQEISTCAEAFRRQIFERVNETDQPQQHSTWPTDQRLSGSLREPGSQRSQNKNIKNTNKNKSKHKGSRSTNPMAIHSLVNALFKYFATRMLTSGLSRWFVYTGPRGKRRKEGEFKGHEGDIATWTRNSPKWVNQTILHIYLQRL